MDVYYLLLDDTIEYRELERYRALLSAERQKKIDRLRYDSDKLLSLTAGLLLRYLLPAGSTMRYNEYGKPYLSSGELYFSLSHSTRAVAAAIDTKEVGVDIERLRSEDIDKLAERFFSGGEQKAYKAAVEKPSVFTEIWTRKESYIKCLGSGLSTDLVSFDTTKAPLTQQIVSVPIEGYFLSVCSTARITDPNISKLELKQLLEA